MPFPWWPKHSLECTKWGSPPVRTSGARSSSARGTLHHADHTSCGDLATISPSTLSKTQHWISKENIECQPSGKGVSKQEQCLFVCFCEIIVGAIILTIPYTTYGLSFPSISLSCHKTLQATVPNKQFLFLIDEDSWRKCQTVCGLNQGMSLTPLTSL